MTSPAPPPIDVTGRIVEVITRLDHLKDGVDELKEGQAEQRRVAEELRARIAGMSHLPNMMLDHETRIRLVEARPSTSPAEHAALMATVSVLADRMKLVWSMLGAIGIALLGLIAHLNGLFAGVAASPH